MIKLAVAIDSESRNLRKRFGEQVEAPLEQAYAELAQKRFEQLGTAVYPDATFTLRLSYGTVKSYKDDDGKTIAPFTNIAGMFERAEQQKFQKPFDPPQSWKETKKKLDMNVPFNFVSTNDIIGGNSGSPVINTRGEVVGCAFDGNIYSLSNNFVYTEMQSRCVSVHVAVIVEALRKIYGATRIVEELGK
jgi:V8-like Glu-specific endopeptidase